MIVYGVFGVLGIGVGMALELCKELVDMMKLHR